MHGCLVSQLAATAVRNHWANTELNPAAMGLPSSVNSMITEPTKPKPRRRCLQYSLRTFFVLVTVLCVCFGWLGLKVHRANEQRKAVAWVRKMRGKVLYDYKFHEGAYLEDGAEPPGPKWLVQLLGAEYFQEVTVVDLDRTRVTDLKPLAGLKNLERLSLSVTRVNDLTPLAGLNSLEELSLEYSQVSDLTPLAGLNRLEGLGLSGTQISDLTPLAKLTSLQGLIRL